MGPEYRRPETRDLTLMTVPWVRVGKTAFTPLSRLASPIRSLSFFSLAETEHTNNIMLITQTSKR